MIFKVTETYKTYIESLGRGIQKIKEACETSNNPPPEYLIHHEDFMITFFVGKPTQTELTELVLAVIREHPNYSQNQIADQLDWKIDRVKYHVKKLKDEKVIKRVGSSHKGHWEVIIEIKNADNTNVTVDIADIYKIV